MTWCRNCSMYIPVLKLLQHQCTDSCNRSMYMRLWRQDVELFQREEEMGFSFYDREDDPLVEEVSQLQYLGRTLEHTYNDWPEVHRNICKAKAVWRRLGKMM